MTRWWSKRATRRSLVRLILLERLGLRMRRSPRLWTNPDAQFDVTSSNELRSVPERIGRALGVVLVKLLQLVLALAILVAILIGPLWLLSGSVDIGCGGIELPLPPGCS